MASAVLVVSHPAWAGLAQDLDPIAGPILAEHPGVRLVKLWAAINPDGRARCQPKGEIYGGWGAVFQAPSGTQWAVMECASSRLATKAYLSPMLPLERECIGIQTALETLKAGGILGPNPPSIEAKLSRPKDNPYPGAPALWEFRIGERHYAVDAYTGKLLTGAAAPAATPRSSTSGGASSRPSKKNSGDSVRPHFDQVAAFAKKKIPGAPLLAIDAIADSDGLTVCFPPSDGWAYYYYLKNFVAVYECRGNVDFGVVGYTPAPERLLPIPAQFIDSTAAMAALAATMTVPRARVTLRLLNHKEPPVAGHSLIWHIHVGNTWYLVDARDGKYLGQGGE